MLQTYVIFSRWKRTSNSQVSDMFLNNVLPACFKFNSYSSQELLCSRKEAPSLELAELSFAESRRPLESRSSSLAWLVSLSLPQITRQDLTQLLRGNCVWGGSPSPQTPTKATATCKQRAPPSLGKLDAHARLLPRGLAELKKSGCIRSAENLRVCFVFKQETWLKRQRTNDSGHSLLRCKDGGCFE